MHKIIVLVMSLFVMSSFANIFDYSKKDLKTYISIGGEYRFMDVENINNSVFHRHTHYIRQDVFDAEAKLIKDSLISYNDASPASFPTHNQFGDNNEVTFIIPIFIFTNVATIFTICIRHILI